MAVPSVSLAQADQVPVEMLRPLDTEATATGTFWLSMTASLPS
jgi:hypothetical protein